MNWIRTSGPSKQDKRVRKREGIHLQSESILDQSFGQLGQSSPPSGFVPPFNSNLSTRSVAPRSTSPPPSPSLQRLHHNKANSLSGSTDLDATLHPNGTLGSALDDPDSEFKARDEQVQQLKKMLKKLTDSCKKFCAEGHKHSKSLNIFADSLDRLSNAERSINPESVYAEALTKFALVEREVSTINGTFHQNTIEQFIARIEGFVEKAINTELKSIKVRYEKARREYDAGVNKVTVLRTKTKCEIVKLYAAEKELKKLKVQYESAKDEALSKIDEIELIKHCDLLEWVLDFLQAQKEAFGENFAILEHMETYLNELESWCHEWRTIFIENTQKRTLEQQALLLEEKALLYDPLNNLVGSNLSLQKIILNLAAEKAEPIALPSQDGNTPVDMPTVHAFMRRNYDQICQALLQGNSRDVFISLSSSLGLLEKGKTEISI